MTTSTVMTLNIAQISYLRAAIGCLLAAQAQAAASFEAGNFELGRRRVCQDLRDDALGLATAYGTVSPLDHQAGAELADLLGSGTLELRAPADAGGITPYYSDEQFIGQVGPEEEAFKVPVTLVVVAETASAAAKEAGEFLSRATDDDEVNYDETVQAYDVVGYESAFVPAAAAASEVLRQAAE